MQTRFSHYSSLKVKREVWPPSGHVRRFEFGIYERIGTGPTRPFLSLVQRADAANYLQRRAQEWLDKGYAVEWHDQQRWFVATHEKLPTVWCALQEAST